jgi:hypothetical protein
MRITRHIVFLLAVAAAAVCAVLVGKQHFAEPEDDFAEVLFCATCVLTGMGALGFVVQFCLPRVGSLLAYLFFGFLAGMMATNFVAEVVSGTRFADVPTDYGLMILLFTVAVAGSVLVQTTDRQEVAEHPAAPYSEPAARSPQG